LPIEEVVWVRGVFFSNLRGLGAWAVGVPKETRGHITRCILESYFRTPGIAWLQGCLKTEGQDQGRTLLKYQETGGLGQQGALSTRGKKVIKFRGLRVTQDMEEQGDQSKGVFA
jgi:hypothetical protein